MVLSTPSSALPLDWKFSQAFGEIDPQEEIENADIISAIEFDKSGDHIAVGDRGGRIVIFERKLEKDVVSSDKTGSWETQHPEFQYKVEFQSHEPEFDPLKSEEISEKINKLRWFHTVNDTMFILATNDKTIKLWKVKEHKVKKVKEVSNPFVCSENMLLAEKSFVSDVNRSPASNGFLLEGTNNKVIGLSSHKEHGVTAVIEDAPTIRRRKVYANAHNYNINSISNNSDGETFLSGDDLRINLWNLEVSSQCYNIVDMKPASMEDLTEVITAAEFHPLHCNKLAYSSSRGFIRLVDMRQSALCDRGAKILQDVGYRGSKTYFGELIASISDIKFSSEGRNILSRDYMNLKLWDERVETCPVATYKIHEHLRPKLNALYENEAMFDKFGCCLSRDGLHFATGSYSNAVRIFSFKAGCEEGVTIEASRNAFRKQFPQTSRRERRSSLSDLARGLYRQGHGSSSSSACDFESKVLNLAWHPKDDLIACSGGSSLYLYRA